MMRNCGAFVLEFRNRYKYVWPLVDIYPDLTHNVGKIEDFSFDSFFYWCMGGVLGYSEPVKRTIMETVRAETFSFCCQRAPSLSVISYQCSPPTKLWACSKQCFGSCCS